MTPDERTVNKIDRSLQQMVDSEQFLATGGILLIYYVCLQTPAAHPTLCLSADEYMYIMRHVLCGI